MVLTFWSQLQNELVSEEGFFSLYRGSTFMGYGIPWWWKECSETSKCQISYEYLGLDLAVWIMVAALIWKAVSMAGTKIKRNVNLTKRLIIFAFFIGLIGVITFGMSFKVVVVQNGMVRY